MAVAREVDILIVGGGVVGLAMATQILARWPERKITLLEKESDVAKHASGRNSGVLHAGFYYTSDSLKARLTVAGNKALRTYCERKGLKVNLCGKLVVARNEEELKQLYVLEERGRLNGSEVRLVTAEQALAIEPNAQTYKFALHSPLTASVDPVEVCQSLKADLLAHGVELIFNARVKARGGAQQVLTNQGAFSFQLLINCAGLYADALAHEFGFGKDYAIIPFRGRYLEYAGPATDLKVHVYPVPDLRNPFLGVHFTKKVSGQIKIGPTATPAFWRENYAGLANFSLAEMLQILTLQIKMFIKNVAGFRQLAWEEIKKYNKSYFVGLALGLVKKIDQKAFQKPGKPGIRAQLIHKKSLKLVQDFIVEGDGSTVHVLNAVSPAFTCSLAFADYVLDSYVAPHMPLDQNREAVLAPPAPLKI